MWSLMIFHFFFNYTMKQPNKVLFTNTLRRFTVTGIVISLLRQPALCGKSQVEHAIASRGVAINLARGGGAEFDLHHKNMYIRYTNIH